MQPSQVEKCTGLRIGFITATDVGDAGAVSGMPHRMHALLAEHHVVKTLGVGGDKRRGAMQRGGGLRRVVRFMVPAAARDWGRQTMREWHERRAATPSQVLARARHLSARVQQRLHNEKYDVLFACLSSGALLRLETSLPIVTYSDATPRMLTETYPYYAQLGRGYARACDRIERTAVRRADCAVFSSHCALESAIRDYGLGPHRGLVVPMGANITPEGHVPAPKAPHRDDVQLFVIAMDPGRKRVDLAVRATELLVSRGFRARLFYVGPYYRPAARSAVVENVGFLRLGDPVGRARHRALLARCHLMLLPSIGEGSPIAPAEAAHFGRPTIATDVGGVGTVVQNGRTGVLLPVSAGAEGYAQVIADLVVDPARYAAMSVAALERAHSTLNWEIWATAISDVLRRAARRAETASRAVASTV